MGGLSLADIAKWDPVAIGEVAQTAQKVAVAVEEAAQPLANMPVFEIWTGSAAGSAQWAMKDSATKAERFVGATKVVGGAASMAQAVVEGLVRANIDIHMQASTHGFRINEAANTVEIAISTAHWSDEDFTQLKADQRELQARVDKLIADANQADDHLAKALKSVADDGRKSIWAMDAKQVDSAVVGALASAKVDLLGSYGKKALDSVDSSLLPWLKEIRYLKAAPVGIAGSVAMMIPGIIADVGDGDSVGKAVVKEAGGVAAGIAAGAAAGAGVGFILPGPGNAIGAVVGAVVGGYASVVASNEIGQAME